ncbi:type VII secretion target [Mycolicibacterium sp. GCM10028919]|uniref:type VII secretion target n=1 Tax=Mycolicibacterium sp. GCM10028919 TaxID=3273401 RepID=UPI00361D31C2
MGHLDSARVDVAMLRDAARGYDAVADAVAHARTHLARLTFDGAVAGRSHAVRGDALRGAVDRIDDGMRRWADAAAAVAAALRSSADRYAAADTDAAMRLG